MDFNKLAKPVEPKKESRCVDCVLSVTGDEVTIKFKLDKDKAKLTSTGKEYYISVMNMAKASIKIDGRDTAIRFQGNLYLK